MAQDVRAEWRWEFSEQWNMVFMVFDFKVENVPYCMGMCKTGEVSNSLAQIVSLQTNPSLAHIPPIFGSRTVPCAAMSIQNTMRLVKPSS